MIEKIKVDEPPEVNCEVVVDKANFVWEYRFYREDTDYVYAYHKGYLWPQRQSGQYYRFRLLKDISKPEDLAEMVWQTFMDYRVFEKDSKVFNTTKEAKDD